MRWFVNYLTVEICRYLVLHCVFFLFAWIVCVFLLVRFFGLWIGCSAPSVITVSSGKNSKSCCCMFVTFFESAYFLEGIGTDCFIAGSRYWMPLHTFDLSKSNIIMPNRSCRVCAVVHQKHQDSVLEGQIKLVACTDSSFLVFWQAVFFCNFLVFPYFLCSESHCCTARPVTGRNSLGFFASLVHWTWNQLVTPQLWILLLENVVCTQIVLIAQDIYYVWMIN